MNYLTHGTTLSYLELYLFINCISYMPLHGCEDGIRPPLVYIFMIVRIIDHH